MSSKVIEVCQLPKAVALPGLLDEDLNTLNQLPAVPVHVICTLSEKAPSDACTLTGMVTVPGGRALKPESPVLNADMLAPALSEAARTQ